MRVSIEPNRDVSEVGISGTFVIVGHGSEAWITDSGDLVLRGASESSALNDLVFKIYVAEGAEFREIATSGRHTFTVVNVSLDFAADPRKGWMKRSNSYFFDLGEEHISSRNSDVTFMVNCYPGAATAVVKPHLSFDLTAVGANSGDLGSLDQSSFWDPGLEPAFPVGSYPPIGYATRSETATNICADDPVLQDQTVEVSVSFRLTKLNSKRITMVSAFTYCKERQMYHEAIDLVRGKFGFTYKKIFFSHSTEEMLYGVTEWSTNNIYLTALALSSQNIAATVIVHESTHVRQSKPWRFLAMMGRGIYDSHSPPYSIFYHPQLRAYAQSEGEAYAAQQAAIEASCLTDWLEIDRLNFAVREMHELLLKAGGE